MATRSEPTPLLETINLSKTFAVPVLKNVNFSLNAGEVHALMGSNGAGKSTLCNIICGIHKASDGALIFDGKPYAPNALVEAEQQGVVMVMQELSLISNLSIAENIFFKRLSKGGGLINHKRLEHDAKALLARVGLHDVDPKALVGSIGVGQQQLVEIAKALSSSVQLLILDEPTAALTDPQIQELFTQLQQLKLQGVGIIYISHRMDEILQIADRISVLRDGEIVATETSNNLTEDHIVQLMVGDTGSEAAVATTTSTNSAGKTALKVEGLGRPPYFEAINLEIKCGEILAIGGLVGSGRSEFVRAIFGADQASEGGLRTHHDNFNALQTFSSPKDAIAAGIGLVTEDRKAEGLLLEHSLVDNISLGYLSQYQSPLALFDAHQAESLLTNAQAELGLKYANKTQAVSELSGGNQQKLLIARWLSLPLDILIFDEPTRGVDAKAKAIIQNLMIALAREGKAIVVVSSETRELIKLGDRIAVLSNGHFAKLFTREEFSEPKFLEACFLHYSKASA